MTDSLYYILDRNGKVMKVHSVIMWGMWFEKNRKQTIVKQEQIGPMWVSTVFLGLDHNFSDHGPPLLFETMVFDSTEESRKTPFKLGEDTPHLEDREMYRYSTRGEALRGHAKVVEKLKTLFQTAEEATHGTEKSG